VANSATDGEAQQGKENGESLRGRSLTGSASFLFSMGTFLLHFEK
jgi:hypothetical protein